MTLLRCAYCGRQRRTTTSLISFPLLNEGCRNLGVRLKAPRSVVFDLRCARRAFKAIHWKNPQMFADLAARTGPRR